MAVKFRAQTDGLLYELKERSGFDRTTVRRLPVAKGVGVVLASRLDATGSEVFALHFSKERFSQVQAEQWMRENLFPPMEQLQALAARKLIPALVLSLGATEQKVLALAAFDAIRRKNYRRARKLLEGLALLNPLSSLAYSGLGRVQQAEKQFDTALFTYKEALKRFANDVEALLGSAEIYLLRAQKKGALPLLLQILALDPEGREPAGREARRLLEAQFTNEDLRVYLQEARAWLEHKTRELPAIPRPIAAPATPSAVAPAPLGGGSTLGGVRGALTPRPAAAPSALVSAIAQTGARVNTMRGAPSMTLMRRV